MTIGKPNQPRSHADRFDACQGAIEDELIELIGRACDAGWQNDEILSAVIALADYLSLARREDISLNIEMRMRQMMKKRDV